MNDKEIVEAVDNGYFEALSYSNVDPCLIESLCGKDSANAYIEWLYFNIK